MKKSLGKTNSFFPSAFKCKRKKNDAFSKGVFICYTYRILNVRKSAINCQNSCSKARQKNVTYINDNYTLVLSSNLNTLST